MLEPIPVDVPAPPVVVPPSVPEPMVLLLDVLPAAPVAPPYCWRQRSRSRPVRPTHWLGSGALEPAPALVPEPRVPEAEPAVVLPPIPGLVLPMPEPVEVVLLEGPLGLVVGAPDGLVLEPMPEPADPEAPVCANEMLAKPTKAAATAAAIVLAITMFS